MTVEMFGGAKIQARRPNFARKRHFRTARGIGLRRHRQTTRSTGKTVDRVPSMDSSLPRASRDPRLDGLGFL